MKQLIKDCIDDFATVWLCGFAGGFVLGTVICLCCYITTC